MLVALPAAVGLLLSMAVAVFARRSGFERDRAFYPTVAIVVASYYVLFAAMGAPLHIVLLEAVVMATFVTAAVIGFTRSPWIVVAALAGHGVFDALHGHVLDNPGVPAWWPAFCLTYDVGAAAGLAWILRHEPTAVRATP
jgi:hypothetical protein